MGTVEEWRDIPGYEGIYEVSNLGNVRSLDRFVKSKHEGFYAFINGKQLTPIKNRAGYLRINLCNEYGRKAKFVHQLVAIAFIKNPNNLKQINHKDENPLNNRVENLEWCTAKYNSNYGNHNKKISEATKGKKKNISKETIDRINQNKRRPVIGTNMETGEEIYIRSISDSKFYGFSVNGVSYCVTKRQKNHRGYTWRYANGDS